MSYMDKNDNWFVYILQCADNTLYTGSTNNLEKRLAKHNSGNGAKYTRIRLPVKIVYSETSENRSTANQREAAIKKLSRTEKLELIKNETRN